MTIAVSIAGLGALIFIHELGHFLASLALRMRPRRFYVGFPPALVKVERNGIEYGIGAIPLGGFVKIPGMHRPSPADVDPAFQRAVQEAPRLTSGVERLRQALALDDHAAARAAMQEIEGALPDAHLSDGSARAAERGVRDIGDALGPDAYWRAKTWKRVVVIAAGPIANILLAVVLFALLYLTTASRATTMVERVVSGTPAAQIGLRSDDKIVEIDGAPVKADEISSAIGGSKGRPLTLIVERGTELIELGPIAPQRRDGSYRLGFVLAGESLSFAASVGESFRVTWLVTRSVGDSVANLATGKGRDEISSPVGIVRGSSDAAKQGTASFFFVLGLISLSIALLNLLPLLPLDGGHIAFALVEGIRGRSVRREIYERVSIVGIGVVLLLFFIGLSNDVGRLS